MEQPRKRSKGLGVVAVVVFAWFCAIPLPSAAVVYDLNADWSNASNPNGAWTYRDGIGALPSQAAWMAGQAAWARAPQPAPGHIVAWMKAQAGGALVGCGGCDFLAGDVLTHSWGAGSGAGSAPPSSVVWTASVAGELDISGSVWLARNIGRAVNWTLIVDGAAVDSGALFDGDAFSRAAPDAFSFLDVLVDAGDTIELRFETVPGSNAEFVGVNLTIDAAQAVAEPVTPLLLALGLAGLAARFPKRRRRA